MPPVVSPVSDLGEYLYGLTKPGITDTLYVMVEHPGLDIRTFPLFADPQDNLKRHVVFPAANFAEGGYWDFFGIVCGYISVMKSLVSKGYYKEIVYWSETPGPEGYLPEIRGMTNRQVQNHITHHINALAFDPVD